MRTLLRFGFSTLFLFASLFALAPAHAQTAAFWTDLARPALSSDASLGAPSAFRSLRLDRAAMTAALARAPQEQTPGATEGGLVVALPMPDGTFADFRVVEASVMAPALQAKYPRLRSYLGQGTTQPAATVRISDTPSGFYAMILSPRGTFLIDPVIDPAAGDEAHYRAYDRRDYEANPERARSAFGNELVLPNEHAAEDARRANSESQGVGTGETLRTYRLALAATGEYTAFHSGRNGNAPNVQDGLDAIVVAITRVNGIYERDVAVRMELVAENDEIVYTDASEDPYTNSPQEIIINENRTNLNDVVGLGGYDIGHVFSTAAGGIAGLGVVCTSSKALGATGIQQPINDVFYVDYVAHEMGHQFGANHSFNGIAGFCGSTKQRNPSTAYEPGSGSTIMGYAGICGGDNIQTRSDGYFHNVSLNEIINYTRNRSGNSCGTNEATGNTPPNVSAEGGFTIPVETPFVLTGTATDAENPSALTYTWEEYDLGTAGSPITDTPPLFRSFPPTEQPDRYFPELQRLLDGNAPRKGENLPVDDQTLRFRFTARDNALGGGGIADIQVAIFTDENAGPFAVTFPNEAGSVFEGGEDLTVTWDVAGTSGGTVNTPTVDVLYSEDNGETFLTLLGSTPNDGAAAITLPQAAAAEARIMVRAVNNIFFDVNDAPFRVDGTVASETRPEERAYALGAVYPNPVGLYGTGQATLGLVVERAETVRVAVYDALGREVAVLHEGLLAAGGREFALDTGALAGGVYFVRVTGDSFAEVRPFTVLP